MTVYRDGVVSAAPETLELSGESTGLRTRLARFLGIKASIRYRDPKSQKELKWKKQPWVLYTADGLMLQPGMEEQELERVHGAGCGKHEAETCAAVGGPVVLLLFEGGIWRWPAIRVGYERPVLANAVLRTMAVLPALFELVLNETSGAVDGDDGFLSTGLLSDVVATAEPRLVKSQTEGQVILEMRSSDQTFLNYGSDVRLSRLQRLTGQLLRAPLDNLMEFQVVRYQVGQHYDAHRDYWDPREFPDVPRFQNMEGFWTMRHATLLWYLQAPDGGGETWFPRAGGGDIPWNAWKACDHRGVKVSPARATAVLFYNLQSNGDIDEFSWHCGCPVKSGVKWAANSWLSNTPGRKRAWLSKKLTR